MFSAIAVVVCFAASRATGGRAALPGMVLIRQEVQAPPGAQQDFAAALDRGDLEAAHAIAMAWGEHAAGAEERLLALAARALTASLGADPEGAVEIRARVGAAPLPGNSRSLATVAEWMFDACLAAGDLVAAEVWAEILAGPAAEATAWNPAVPFAQLGYAWYETEAIREADRCYARSHELLDEESDAGLGFELLLAYALTRRNLGDHLRALDLLAGAEELLAGAEDAPKYGEVALRRAGVLSDLGDYARAEADLAVALAAALEAGDAEKAQAVRILAAEHAARAQRLDAAAAWLAEPAPPGAPPWSTWQRKTVRTIESRLALRAGDAVRARERAEEALAAIGPESPREYLLLPRLARARAALAQGDFATVEEALRQAEDFLTSEEIRSRGDARVFLRTRYADWLQLVADLAWERVAAAAAERRAAVVAAAWEEVDRWKARTLAEDVGLGGRPASSIPEDSVLLDFVGGERVLYAFRRWEDREELFALGARADLGGLLTEYHGMLADPAFVAPIGEIARVGRALHERLLAATLPRAARLVLVVPETDWPAVPFAALVSAAPAEGLQNFSQLRFAVEDAGFVQAPSRAIGLRLPRLAPDGAAPGALVLADPQCPDGRWPPLPGTRDEAAAVQAVLPSARLLVGAAARKGDFLAALADARVVHVASHAWADPLAPERSRIACSGEGSASDLTLAELRAARLSADVVVLSACETAGGRALRGEGVQSLAAGFLQAGAGSVVATLWPVFDADAAQLMHHFYALRGHADVALALRAAQLELLRGETPVDLVALSRGVPAGGRPLAPAAGRVAPLEGHPMRWAGFVYFGPFGG